MAHQNVIEQLTRYAVRSHQDPRENRLTAGLVATLGLSQPLTRRVLAQWGVDVPASGTIRVVGQEPVGVGYIDLAITTETPAPETVWIEAKLHSALSGPNQVRKYQCALNAAADGKSKHLLLLV